MIKPPIWFEYDIAAHCNLNCAGCSHFSPVAEKELISAEKAEQELSRLGEVCGGECRYVHIMGGEPLLNPEVEKILAITRACFPVGHVQLVTNGTLLLSQPESFWKTCQDNQVELYITKYPVSIPLSQIRAYAAIWKIKLKWFRNGDQFLKYTMDPAGSNDMNESYAHCPIRMGCPQYHNGKFYRCTISGCVYRLNQAFGCHFEEGRNDYVDLFSDVTLDDLVQYMSNPIPFCRYCNCTEWKNSLYPWHVSERIPDEWIKPKGDQNT